MESLDAAPPQPVGSSFDKLSGVFAVTAAAPAASARRIGFGAALLASAAGLFAVQPLSTDIYITVMVDIGREFSASMGAAQRATLAFTLGFGLAHLFVGELADRHGRRPVALVGMALYVAASALAIDSPTLTALIGARFLQGLAASTGPILARAIVRDATRAEESGGAMAKMLALMSLAPICAPFLGATLSNYGGWRAAAAVLAVYGAGLGLALWRGLPETRPRRAHGAERVSWGRALRHIVAERSFVIGAAALGCAYGALLTWLTTSAFVLISVVGLTKFEASTILTIGAAMSLVGGAASFAASRRLAPRKILRIGATLLFIGAFAPALMIAGGAATAPWLAVTAACFYFGWAFGQPMAIALAMRPFPEMAGQASAWLGLAQQVIGVVISASAGLFAPGAATLGVMSAGALGFCAVAFWPEARRG